MSEAAALLAADAEARRLALDPARSFLLQAPAGSGKTTVLSGRLLALLAVVDAPEEVLAITFTRKAAAEMRARVLRALWRAAEGRAVDAHEAGLAEAALRRDRERGWGLLGNPTRLRILTIDAFCQRLAMQLPVTGRAGGRSEVALPATALYRAAARRVLERAVSEAGLLAATRVLFLRLDNDWQRLEELLVLMLEQRAHWLPRLLDVPATDLGTRVAAGLAGLLRRQLQRARDSFPAGQLAAGAVLVAAAAHNRAADARPGKGGAGDEGVRAWLAEAGDLQATGADLARWRFLAECVLTGEGQWRKAFNINNGVPRDQPALKARLRDWVADLARQAGLREALAEVLQLPDALLAAEDAGALAGLSALLRHAAAELQLEFAARGRVDHAAIASAARAALVDEGEPTDLALRCGEAIRHVLVDEFQDTSLEQFELLRALTAGWQPGDGRTLFAVGDPMQSIYQFREAEVGLFLRAREQGIGAIRPEFLELRRNFRSAPGLIAWVNAACGRVFPASDDPWLAAIRYLPALWGGTVQEGGVQVHALPTPDPVDEARRIAGLALAERERRPGCSIAVLVPARRHAEPIAQALKAAGLAVRGVQLEPLAERAVVRDLGALTRSLLHPGDRTAWLALLRAPWCGLTVPELLQLCEGRDEPIWELLEAALAAGDLAADTRLRLQRLHAALAPALRDAERGLALALRVERCWLRLGGPACARTPGELRDAESYLLALEAQAEAELPAGDACDELVAGLYASPEAGPDAVEILTVHAAKGLEWDVVFLPAIGRGARGDRDPLLHWLDLPDAGEGAGLLLAPIRAAGRPAARALDGYIAAVKAQRRQVERTRLLYVAATRARHQLHWLGHAQGEDDSGAPVPRAGTALATLWPAIEAQFRASLAAESAEPAAVPGPETHEAAAAMGEGPWRLPADWSPTGLPEAVPTQHLDLSLHAPATRPEYSWVGLGARIVGTLVHAELQRFAGLAELPDPASLRAADYLPWLAERGVPEGEAPACAGRIVAALAGALRDERGRWLLRGAGREAWSELRLAGLHEGRIVSISIDRMLLDEEGTRWIIDYKTGTHEGGDLDAFLADELVRHAPQLQRYAALVGAMWPGPLRTALYFPLLGEFRELPRPA